jgi:hypothetical protein
MAITEDTRSIVKTEVRTVYTSSDGIEFGNRRDAEMYEDICTTFYEKYKKSSDEYKDHLKKLVVFFEKINHVIFWGAPYSEEAKEACLLAYIGEAAFDQTIGKYIVCWSGTDGGPHYRCFDDLSKATDFVIESFNSMDHFGIEVHDMERDSVEPIKMKITGLLLDVEDANIDCL